MKKELEPKFIKPSEAATITGLSTRTITDLCQRGKLPAVKLGHRWLIDQQKFAAMVETK